MNNLNPHALEAANTQSCELMQKLFDKCNPSTMPAIDFTKQIIQAYLSALPAVDIVQKWQPITEEQKNGNYILACGWEPFDKQWRWGKTFWSEGRWVGGSFNSHCQPTHFCASLDFPAAPEIETKS